MNSTTYIRVRFAPSPTGYLHVGGLRTALYNYLFARSHNGTFVLRIEDTDRTRYVEGAVENLIATLAWTGLTFDEGPGIEGKFGPYIQSQRLEIYRKHAQPLFESRKAYRCFCTPERLEEMRKQQERMKIPPKYDRRCLRLSESEIQKNLEDKVPFAIRMKIPETTTVHFHDLIRGKVEFDSDRIDDQVILKSDGYPTYHLANVVDDHLMEISHVIRGEEWLSSTPKHILLYQYFGWEPPVFAHLPLLLNPDKSKLSKRQGDVAVEEYRAKGYLPEALINFVALLGWNPGDNRELFRLEELVKEFSLERVGKSGAIFNMEKLNWINQQHLRQRSDEDLAALVQSLLKEKGMGPPDRRSSAVPPRPAPTRRRRGERDEPRSDESERDLDPLRRPVSPKARRGGSGSEASEPVGRAGDQPDAYLREVVRLMKDRVTTLNDFVTFGAYLLSDLITFDDKAVQKNWNSESPQQIRKLLTRIEALKNLTHLSAEEAVRSVAEEYQVPAGKIIHAVRLALTGISVGPGLFELMEVLGKEKVIRRLRTALEKLPRGRA